MTLVSLYVILRVATTLNVAKKQLTSALWAVLN